MVQDDGAVARLLPADCLAIEEIGAAGKQEIVISFMHIHDQNSIAKQTLLTSIGKWRCSILLSIQSCIIKNAFVVPGCKFLSFLFALCLSGAVFDVLAWLALVITALFMAFKAQQVRQSMVSGLSHSDRTYIFFGVYHRMLQVEDWMRKYYYLNTYICGVASFAYFAMFSGMDRGSQTSQLV